jgi:serine phosphatase RsbU (regulator of sigma subunit)
MAKQRNGVFLLRCSFLSIKYNPRSDLFSHFTPMFQRLYIFSLFVFSGFLNAQVNYDSLSIAVKKENRPRKKLELYLKKTEDTRLSITDYEHITREVLELGRQLHKESYSYAILAGIYSIHNNFDKAIEYAELALGKAESDKDTITLGYANLRIGHCFVEQKNFDKAIFYLRTSLHHYSRLPVDNSYNKLKEVYNSMGNLFKDRNMLDSALYYHQRSLELAIRARDRRLQAFSFNNLGLVYKKMNRFDKALEYYEMAAFIKKELKDYNSLCGTIINKAAVLEKMGKHDLALINYEEGIKMAEEYKRGNFLLVGVQDLAVMQMKQKDYKNAALNYQKYYRLTDSIDKGKEKKKLDEIAARYESEKKDAEILKGREDIKIQQTIIKKQKQFNYAIIGGLCLAFICVGVVYRSYRLSRKFSRDLSAQKTLIEEKNKEITDSINYAKRIQESLLTSGSLFEENTKDFFILFQPKDIVSGDFYWAQRVEEGLLVMCGDCTGHGVPGAFMSLLGISYLTEIVQQHHIHKPHLIFNALKSKVITNLNQKDEARKDGMDASMIRLNGMNLEFACSHNPIWIIRDQKIIKFKADKSPIGMGVNDAFSFTPHTETLLPGDSIYMFTDGYADQFGGPNGKKFKVKQLEEKMLAIASLNMKDQKRILEEHFNNWKGELDQVDDVLVIGISV